MLYVSSCLKERHLEFTNTFGELTNRKDGLAKEEVILFKYEEKNNSVKI